MNITQFRIIGTLEGVTRDPLTILVSDGVKRTTRRRRTNGEGLVPRKGLSFLIEGKDEDTRDPTMTFESR